MDAQKAIERIVSNQGMISLDTDDFGPLDSLQYYGLHSFTVETKKLEPQLDFNFDTSNNYKVVVNVTSGDNISLFVIEEILTSIREKFEGEINIIYGHSVDSDSSKVLVDVFVYL